MCTVGRWSFDDREVEKACCRAYREAVRAGRGTYLVVDAGGHLHVFLSLHKPAQEVLAIIGTHDDGSSWVVWMEEWHEGDGGGGAAVAGRTGCDSGETPT